ncbi:helix-turn-helix transcriptional regulator [Mucilaginibacter sp. JRF]|uniref:helix-turn-helix domain-containing protein n=1 Tax=Mucilaginibacter sp. JRF TaxID=2780088 RepID=UPI00187FBB57|nr:helix-turn-helix transcriptional regulator [Mucilaginibacter sp. JRF]MBE9586688.1 helix-turn-helix transcriptional regulator [Mucilaginibacter sp. JRF]
MFEQQLIIFGEVTIQNMADERVHGVLTNIKRRRKVLGYSSDYLAGLINLSSNAYYKIETGRTPITLANFLAIVEVLNTSIDKLMQPPL